MKLFQTFFMNSCSFSTCISSNYSKFNPPRPGSKNIFSFCPTLQLLTCDIFILYHFFQNVNLELKSVLSFCIFIIKNNGQIRELLARVSCLSFPKTIKELFLSRLVELLIFYKKTKKMSSEWCRGILFGVNDQYI